MGTKLFIIGKRLTDYTDKKTGEAIKGIRVFFFCRMDGVEGYYTDGVWIDAYRQPDLYAQVAALKIGEDPMEAEFVYNVIPGRRTQQLVAIKVAA